MKIALPRTLALAAALLAAATVPSLAQMKSLRVARVADALTLDPHAQNEGPTHNILHQIYEPLVQRAINGDLLPTLAVSWKVTGDPTVWEFKLRPGVQLDRKSVV